MKTVREILYATLNAMGSLTAYQFRELHPELNPNSISSSLNYMLSKGYIKATRMTSADPKNRAWRDYYVYEMGDKQLPDREALGMLPRGRKPGSKNKVRVQTEAGAEATISALKARIRELEDWKAEAIERFPDLSVPEPLRRARDLVASELDDTDKHLAGLVRAGQRDGILPMRIAIKLLEG